MSMLRFDSDFLETKDGAFLAWAHEMYEYELEQQLEGRSKRARDEAFYDGNQFTPEQLAVYEARNQTPRTYNEIKPAIDWIIGSERRARSDWSVLPRTDDDVEPAVLKSRLVKYIDDINKAKMQRSLAFEDCVKTGEGWTYICVEPNEDGQPHISISYEDWQNVIADSKSVRMDLKDCRYIWRSKIIDLETLKTYFPDKAAEIEAESDSYDVLQDELYADHTGGNMYDAGENLALNSCDGQISVLRTGSMSLLGGRYMSSRQAVRVWELWYRKTERVELLTGAGGLTGEIFDNDRHKGLLGKGKAGKREIVREQMYMALYTGRTVLYHDKSIYKHNRFPFVRRIAFMHKQDKTPYGVIRQIIDPQTDLNERRNYALWLMASRRVIADEGAVDDKDEAIDQVAKVNGYIEIKQNKRFEIMENANIASAHVNFAEMDSAYVKQISGVTSENRGMNNNALSGIAIQSLQEQGTVITTPIIDNHVMAHQLEGELVLSLCEQFINSKMQFRITGNDLNPKKQEFVTLNSKPETDITATQADFIVAQRDYRQSMRQALSEQLLMVAGNIGHATGNPMATMLMVELAIDLQDFPNKDQMVHKLREIMQLPPKNETDEERQAREQAMAAQQQAEQAHQEKLKELAIMKALSDVDYNNARSAQLKAEGRRELANARNSQAEALAKYMQSAGLVAQNANLSTIADDLIRNMDNIMAGMGDAEIELSKAVAPQEAQQAMQPMQQPPMEQPPMQLPQGQPMQGQLMLPPPSEQGQSTEPPQGEPAIDPAMLAQLSKNLPQPPAQ